MKYIFTRRELLKMAVLVPSAAILAACANIPVGIEQPTIAPTFPPEPTAKPNTETPLPTATVKPSATRAAPTRTATMTPEPTETSGPTTIIFDLIDGTKFEMLQFETAEEAIEYIQGDTRWRKGDVYEQSSAQLAWSDDYRPEVVDYGKKVSRIPGYGLVFGYSFIYPPQGEDYFLMAVVKANGGKTIFWYNDLEDRPKAIYVDAEASESILTAQQYQFSTPTPQP